MKIDGIDFISINHSKDDRGSSKRLYDAADIDGFICNEIFLSSSKKDVIRGMHFQEFPYCQKKLITVLKGSIEGVILDLRKGSDTYLNVECVKMNEESATSLLIPELCAWGFHAIEDKNVVLYNISGKYKAEFDMGIRWDSIGYDWKVVNPVLSQRDKTLMSLEEYVWRQKDEKI